MLGGEILVAGLAEIVNQFGRTEDHHPSVEVGDPEDGFVLARKISRPLERLRCHCTLLYPSCIILGAL